MWTTSELEIPLLTTTPHQWEDVSAIDSYGHWEEVMAAVTAGFQFSCNGEIWTVQSFYVLEEQSPRFNTHRTLRS
ncbi:hypothetical protein TNCV_3876801 [Trichonephila clavipes]|uniref:Uncharacterized protein n=1 Tax=Trichonephila clavipes TaxID=2585209 RepID=A0A8X6SS57_TRICX|nr:hypothetical protein TNCV_3876801 [Trichonephila clavipes]